MLARIARNYRDAYAGLPRMAWILSLVELVNRSGTMVIFFLGIYVTQELGYSVIQAGHILGVWGVGSLTGAYLGGWLCDRIGAHTVQKLSLLLTGMLFVVVSFVTRFPVMLGLVFVTGLVSDALHPANGTAMIRACPPDLRVKGFALNRLAANLGVTIGPVVGGYLALRDYHLLFWVDGATCLLAAAVLSFFLRDGRSGAPITVTGGDGGISPWRDRVFLALTGLMFGLGLIFSQLFSTFPLYLKDAYGLLETGIGYTIAVNTVLIIVFEMLLMHRLRHHPPARVLAVGVLFFGWGYAMMPLGRGFAFAALTVAIWTVGEMLTLPTISGLVANRAGESHQGRYMAVFSLSFTLTSIVGPVAGTEVYSRWGGDWVWVGVGLLSLLLWCGFRALAPRLAADSRGGLEIRPADGNAPPLVEEDERR
jgi:predicted MFS family arabinose efflux permease